MALSPGPQAEAGQAHHLKMRNTSAACFFATSDSEDKGKEIAAAVKDKFKEYLALPQIKYTSERGPTECWIAHREQLMFTDLEVIARQYLGCPALSGSIERIFSKVGSAFNGRMQHSAKPQAQELKYEFWHPLVSQA